MAGETESTAPESVDVAGAIALMGELAKDADDEEKAERESDTAADGGDGDDADAAEADEDVGESEEPEEAADEEVRRKKVGSGKAEVGSKGSWLEPRRGRQRDRDESNSHPREGVEQAADDAGQGGMSFFELFFGIGQPLD